MSAVIPMTGFMTHDSRAPGPKAPRGVGLRVPLLRAIVALLVTLALVALAMVVLRPSPTPTPNGLRGGVGGGGLVSKAAINTAVAAGGRLSISLPTGSSYVFASDGNGFGATVTRPGQPMLVWPANAARVRAALQLLGDTPLTPTSGAGDGTGGAVGAVVKIGDLTLAFDGTPLGGHVAVRVSESGADPGAVQNVGVGLADLFTDAGLMLWLDVTPLHNATEATRLELVKAAGGGRVGAVGTVGTSIELVRKGSEWWLATADHADALIPADRAAVTDLLSRIASISAASVDGVADADVLPEGLRAPGGELILSLGAGDGAISKRLAFVMDGSRARAVATVPGGTAMLTLDVRPESLFPEVSALIARTSLPRPAADALRVTIARPEALGHPVVIERAAGAWRTGGTDLPAADARTLDDILRVLAQTRADVVRIGTPADFVHSTLLVVHDLSGSEACRLLVGRAKPPTLPGAPEAAAVLCIVTPSSADQHDTTKAVTRMYGGKTLPPVIEWLAAQHP